MITYAVPPRDVRWNGDDTFYGKPAVPYGAVGFCCGAQVVLELLKGENLEELSRKYAVTMSEINAWQDEFIRNGTDGFRRNPEEAKLSRAERKIGQLEMELELVKKRTP